MRYLLIVLIPMLGFAGWMRTYEIGDLSIGHSVRQTSDGGYIIAGQSGDENQCDLLLIKTDSLGDTLWTRIYGGGGAKGKCVQQTKDGGYIILGFTNVEEDIWPAGDIWLLKTNSEGDTIWTRIYLGYNFPYGGWVEQTKDGGYVFTSNWDMAYLLLLKADKNGNTEWSKNYQWGSQQIETGYCVRPTNDGGYVVATNMGLFKTNDKGDSLWLKSVSSGCVVQTLDGGYIQATSHYEDIWLIKTDTLGDTMWTKTYGGEDEDYSKDVLQTNDGGYVVIGETRPFGAGKFDAWLLKTDSLGDTLWTRIIGGERGDNPYSVQQTTDGGYIFTGCSTPDYSSPGDVWLVKTDSLGYVGVAEPPVQVELNWQVISSIGPQITLRYTDRPQGFSASIFDATGRKVDELRSASCSGTVSWGTGYESGVYFIKPTGQGTTARVIIIH